MDPNPAESQAERDERLRHGSSFGVAAAAYAEHRPDYADAAIRWALEPVWSRQPLRVVDLGAGTGKLTAALVRLGAEVTAVEPDQQMLAELRREMPGVRSLPGHAEDIPLPDGSVDAILAAQSMHWFDMDRAIPEIARVLTPGGVLAGLWNVDDNRVGWVAELAEISKRKSSVTLLRWRGGCRGLPSGTPHRGRFGRVPRRAGARVRARAGEDRRFPPGDHRHPLPSPGDGRARARQRCWPRSATSFARGRRRPAGEFVLPMVTVVLRAQRN